MDKKQIPIIVTAFVIINFILTLALLWKGYHESKLPNVDFKSSGAASSSNQSIGVINVEKILSGSQAASSINKQVETLRTNYQKWGEAKEKELRDKEAALVKQQPKLTEEQFGKQRQELEQSMANFQREAMEKKQQMEAATHEGVDKIKQNIVTIAQDIAKKEGLSHILADTFLVYFNEGTDLTDKVLPELNKRLPNVKIEVKNEPKQK